MRVSVLAAAGAALLWPSGAAAEPLTEETATGSRVASRVDRKKVESEKESTLVEALFQRMNAPAPVPVAATQASE